MERTVATVTAVSRLVVVVAAAAPAAAAAAKTGMTVAVRGPA